jgi:alkaline phosphatase
MKFALILVLAAICASADENAPKSAILFSVDGASVSTWTAARWLSVGPDGDTNWDRLPGIADYRGHFKDVLAAGSNPAVTVHAYGVKVDSQSYGMDAAQPVNSLSGKTLSIMQEAMAAGKSVGIANTAELSEAGSGAFFAHVVQTRKGIDKPEVVRQVIEAKPDLILAGGEVLMLPEGVMGRHGEPGVRKDGLNLIERAKALGYTVVFTRDELQAVPLTAERVLGVFAPMGITPEESEEGLLRKNLPPFFPSAPTTAEMAAFALRFLGRNPKGFFFSMNEEGTDNYAGEGNARDALQSLRRADEAIGVFRDFVDRQTNTLLLVTADAPAGGMVLLGRLLPPYVMEEHKPLPAKNTTHASGGAPLDGRNGKDSAPFVSAPDRAGKRHLFAVSWASRIDNAAGVLTRAAGYNSHLVRGGFDNTKVYRVLYETLFGRDPATAGRSNALSR